MEDHPVGLDRPGRPARGRLEKRVSRLKLLIGDQDDVAARARMSREMLLASKKSGAPIASIAVRLGLLRKDGGQSEPQTRIQEVSAPRSAALQVLLLTLFELQARGTPIRPGEARTRLPIEYRDDPLLPSWVDLTALPTIDSTSRRAHARDPKSNRERQIKRALQRLAECGRIELQPKKVHDRFERFAVLNEAVRNGGDHGTTYYTVPERAAEDVVDLPVEFIVNGWLDALTDTETITYLTLRYVARMFPGTHRNKGIYLVQQDRQQLFNLDRGFDAHRMLGRFGLIHTIRDSRRQDDGTIPNFETVGAGDLHRFTLNDTALNQPAVPQIITSLTRMTEGAG